MLMETATYKTPQEEKSLHFPFTTTAINDNSANDFDYQSSNLTMLDANNEFPVEQSKKG